MIWEAIQWRRTDPEVFMNVVSALLFSVSPSLHGFLTMNSKLTYLLLGPGGDTAPLTD